MRRTWECFQFWIGWRVGGRAPRSSGSAENGPSAQLRCEIQTSRVMAIEINLLRGIYQYHERYEVVRDGSRKESIC